MEQIKLDNKSILVTGSSGFLAEKLIDTLLNLGAQVHAVDIRESRALNPDPNFHFQKIDLLDQEELKKFVEEVKPNFIFHLAASLNRSRDFKIAKEIMDINLMGTINLLNALEGHRYENLIFTSTSEVYGGEEIASPFKEEAQFVPASPYSLSKYCAEMAIKSYSTLHGNNYSILRLFNFYSSDMPKSFFLPGLIYKLERNEDFDMTKGEQVRDYLHVNDVIDALVLSTSKMAMGQVFNVCSGEGRSIKDLAKAIKRKLNSHSNINFGAIPYRPNEVWIMIGDNEKIKQKLNWKPKVNLLENLN